MNSCSLHNLPTQTKGRRYQITVVLNPFFIKEVTTLMPEEIESIVIRYHPGIESERNRTRENEV